MTVKAWYSRAMESLYLACIVVSATALVLITLVIPYGVFMRYVMKSAASWPEPFSVLASQSFATASEATGIPPNEIEELLAGRGDAQKVCKLMKGFFDAVLGQPLETAAPALRALASGERGIH